MEIISIRTPSLGDTSYVAIHDGSAIIIDPQRDIDRVLEILEQQGATATHVLETHMHNDYISGGRDLASQTGATLVLPAAAGAGFAFVAAFHQETLDDGGAVSITPIHTPGHTPAHTSYLLSVDGESSAVFTGGSLLVGAAGRSDLLGVEFAEQLSRLQYGSLQRLAALADDTGVYPTHGEGSFCTATGAGRSTSTIAIEKAENPLYTFDDAESFMQDQTTGLLPYPRYYAFMGPRNRTNPTAIDIGDVPELDAAGLDAAVEAGAAVFDGRDRYHYAQGHLPGSLGIELGDSFAPWAGWLVDIHRDVVLVLNSDQSAADAVRELCRVGFESIVGVARADGPAFEGRELASYTTASITELADKLADGSSPQVLDVRDPLEREAGHIAGSAWRYVPDLVDGPPTDVSKDEPVWVVCRSGNRASIAAGLLEGYGYDLVVVAKGGAPDII